MIEPISITELLKLQRGFEPLHIQSNVKGFIKSKKCLVTYIIKQRGDYGNT